MPDVTKNLLILNVIVFLASITIEINGISLSTYLSMHDFRSELFEPYQLVSHMFSHGSFLHLLTNMIGVVIFGSMLERVWGPKKYILFYFACGFGALALHLSMDYYFYEKFIASLEFPLRTCLIYFPSLESMNEWLHTDGVQVAWEGASYRYSQCPTLHDIHSIHTGMLGASGALFGVMVAFAMHFPNTELMLLFFPVPIKAKYFVSLYAAFEIYSAYQMNPNDNVAHFAHLGGALIGFILVMIWRRDRRNFY